MESPHMTHRQSAQQPGVKYWQLRESDGVRRLVPTFNVHTLTAISTSKQQFDADVTFTVSWLDKWPDSLETRPTHDNPLNLSMAEFREYGFWDARITVFNLYEDKTREADQEWVKIFPCKDIPALHMKDGDGCVVLYCRHILGTFNCQMSLAQFPLDRQKLPIILQSLQDTGRAKFELRDDDTAYRSLIDPDRFYLSSQFELDDTPYQRVRPDTDARFSTTNKSYSSAECSFFVQRLGGHFVNNIVLPLFMLTALSHVAAFIDEEQLGERLSVSLTMVLAAIAFKFVVTQELPNIQYMTWCDLYVNLNFLWMCANVVENLIASELDAKHETEQYIAIFMLAAWCVLNLCIAVVLTWNSWFFPQQHE